MQLVKSYNDDNAVKVIAFAVNFMPLSVEEMVKLISKLDTQNNIEYFDKEFNIKKPTQEVTMTIHADGTQQHELSIGGIMYEKTNDTDMLIWNLTINKNSIIVSCREYTRWDAISAKAIEFISKVMDNIVNMKITHITLEYIDEFEIINHNGKWKEELFKTNCDYNLSHIYKLDDFWHINHGYFFDHKNLKFKLLDTLNINYFADENDNLKHKVNVITQHMLTQINESYDKSNIKKYFDIIHQHSKEIFEAIINDNILKTFNRG
ncbi:hypothetical protein BN3087_380006 [Sulfurovum sp. enrichment culture clone C5]|uniref:TIGR04255 family protein n=1 Tax=Sulfurovum sp. enrichment culture clone C5 TaxID=497650 RepID=A0A0S4XME2_9BACT|nr:hypothetical protein BN3087_380006 [Sulfurovum sp. enrichment culture clone C5]